MAAKSGLLSQGVLRTLCRSGAFTGTTSGAVKGYIQVNMMIVPREYAFDFLLFCQRNVKPCFSGKFSEVHAVPSHIGHPEPVDIHGSFVPDFGDTVDVLADVLPVFWACGVTPQYVAQPGQIPFCISHSPGKMLVTDIANG